MCSSALKIRRQLLFILGFFFIQLGKNIPFGFGKDTENRSRFNSESSN